MSLKILLVDDHPLVTEGLSSVLQGENAVVKFDGKPVISTSNQVSGALAMLDAGEQFDLILLDLSMPEMTGFDLLKALQANRLPIPAIVLSATDEIVDIQRVWDLGASGFVGKFEPADQLLAKICQVLEGQRTFPASFINYLESEPETVTLTPRQIEVLELIATGHSNKQISAALEVSQATVKFHVSEIFQALGVHNRTHCVREATKMGLISSAS